MNSVSAISISRPLVSRLAPRIALWTCESVTPKARSFSGSTSTWYWRTKPPTEATSETPSRLIRS